MALVNGRSKLAKILAEEGRWRRSPATAHQDSLAETGKLRTLREGTESIVFVHSFRYPFGGTRTGTCILHCCAPRNSCVSMLPQPLYLSLGSVSGQARAVRMLFP